MNFFSPPSDLLCNPSISLLAERFPLPSSGILLKSAGNFLGVIDYRCIAPSGDDTTNFARVFEGLAVLASGPPGYGD